MVKNTIFKEDTEARKWNKLMWEANKCKKKSIVGRFKDNLNEFQDILGTTEDL